MRALTMIAVASCCATLVGAREAKSAALTVDPKVSCLDLTTNQLASPNLAPDYA